MINSIYRLIDLKGAKKMKIDYSQKSVIRLPEVMRRTGLSRSTIYAYMQKGFFPQSVSLGVRAVGWYDCDIDAWIECRG